ncbi:MAG: hypothetical protein AAF708_00795 [Deinococcota bacterium]
MPALLKDLPWLFELHKATLKVYVEKLWGWDETWQKNHFFATCNLDDSQIIVFEDKPIGRLTVINKMDYVFLAYIAILPNV